MSKTQSVLRHLRFGSVTPFSFPQRLQDQLAREFLDHKALLSSPLQPSPLPAVPTPTIITFTPLPVYTTGRREHGTLSDDQLKLLKAPLPSKGLLHKDSTAPEVWPTQRGGQTTFHGPGQIVIYPVFDLKATYPLWPKGLSPRCYVNLLEQTTINTLAQWGLKGIRTDNPGVWAEDGERKIAALGVHLRRNITSYGVGLNVHTDLRYFDRIVACGLVDKKVTSMKELASEAGLYTKSIWNGTKLQRAAALTAKFGATQEEVAMDGSLAEQKVDTSPSAKVYITNRRDQAERVHHSQRLRQSIGSAWIEEFIRGMYGDGHVIDINLNDAWRECQTLGIL